MQGAPCLFVFIIYVKVACAHNFKCALNARIELFFHSLSDRLFISRIAHMNMKHVPRGHRIQNRFPKFSSTSLCCIYVDSSQYKEYHYNNITLLNQQYLFDEFRTAKSVGKKSHLLRDRKALLISFIENNFIELNCDSLELELCTAKIATV